MVEILLGKKFKCAFCRGSGVQPRSLASRCIACRGKGEVEFGNPAVKCFSCQGKGTASGSSMLACIRCAGRGAIEKDEEDKNTADTIGKRLGEITKRLRWTRKEVEEKTKEIERRLKPITPFIKEVKEEIPRPLRPGSRSQGDLVTQWFEKLENKIKKGWQSLWGK